MATEHIPQMDKLFKDYGERFRENAKKANKILEQVGEAIKKFQESEEKSMLHNVTVKHEENKVLEEFWVMYAMKNEGSIEYNLRTGNSKVLSLENCIVRKRESKEKPSKNEIAQFLSDSHADFVSVV